MFLLPLLTIRVSHSLSLSDAVFALAAVVLLMSRRRPVVGTSPMWYFGSFLIVASGIASSFVATSPFGSLQVVFNGIYVLFVWQWTTRSVLTDVQKVQKAITYVVLGCTLSSAVAIVQTKLHVLGYRGATGGSEGARALGLTNQPNIAAVTYALGLTLCLGLVLHLGRGRRSYRVVCLGVIAIALILSASVSGMATALVGIFVILVKRGMKPRTIAAAAVLLVGVYSLGVIFEGHGNGGEDLNPIARVEQTTGTGTGYNTVTPRVQTLKNTWTGIQQSPILGHGIDQVSLLVYYDPYLATYYPTHNFLLLVWYGGGIFMLCRHRRGRLLLHAVAGAVRPLDVAAIRPCPDLPSGSDVHRACNGGRGRGGLPGDVPASGPRRGVDAEEDLRPGSREVEEDLRFGARRVEAGDGLGATGDGADRYRPGSFQRLQLRAGHLGGPLQRRPHHRDLRHSHHHLHHEPGSRPEPDQ
jgi:hypothetical protein